MKPLGWVLIGALVALAGSGAWYVTARSAWLAHVAAADRSAHLAQAQHAADSAQLDRNADRLRYLQRQADTEAQEAQAAALAQQAAHRRADHLSAALDSAKTARDSIPILVARDSARVLEVAHADSAATGWRRAFEAEKERAAGFEADLTLARGDAARLAQAVADLRRQIATAVPPPPRIGWKLPTVVGAVAGVVAGIVVFR